MSQQTLLKVTDSIDHQKSFILEAGAGSGKTWTLIESLRHIIKTQSDKLSKNGQKVACITYTNVAKDEIISRIEQNSLIEVHTFHEFLWSQIKRYQTELKAALCFLNDQKPANKQITDLSVALKPQKIIYSEFASNWLIGEIFHNDVLKLAEYLFKTYPKLCRITADRFPVIFMDEYQDTEEPVRAVLLDHLLTSAPDKITIGFFGDAMQKIYNSGIGELEDERLDRITKLENYRCSKTVISLLNHIRTDLQQFPAGDNLEGSTKFIHSNAFGSERPSYKLILEFLQNNCNWPSENTETKVLVLTHNKIAGALGFAQLLRAYTTRWGSSFGRDKLYKRQEAFSKFIIEGIEQICELYETKQYSHFLKRVHAETFKITQHSDKEKLQEIMSELNSLRQSGTIKNVIEYVLDNNFLSKPDKVKSFEDRINPLADLGVMLFELTDEEKTKEQSRLDKDRTFNETLMTIPYLEVLKLKEYLDENTPFSTKHGVKGEEYDNVLVVVDDTAWNQYKFDSVFSADTTKTQYNRSNNLLYVCCSRAINNLAIYSISDISAQSLTTIQDWFGDDNVLDVKQI